MYFSIDSLQKHITYKTSRSGGKGGQNVNKVASKVELNFNIDASDVFNEEQKNRIKQKLSNRLNADGFLQVICEEERSQLLNKEMGLKKLKKLLDVALHEPKIRKATKPKKSSVENRLKEKQLQTLKKLGRKKNFFD